MDGGSGDSTRDIATRFGATVLDHDGQGVGSARMAGILAARSRWVFLLDSDVILPDGALAALLDELNGRDLVGLQVRLHSVSGGPGYWGQALARHHQRGRGDNKWFGFAATLFDRRTLIEHPFDRSLPSGEDLDLARRLSRHRTPVGISKTTVATHILEDRFHFARRQWLADGQGIAAVLLKERWPVWLLVLPALAGLRGAVLTLARREVRGLPFYVGLVVFNYLGIARQLFARWG